jgi:hypothetical protein
MVYEVSSPKKYEVNGETKTHWVKIGRAFDNKDKGITVYLDALPLQQRDGAVTFQLFEKGIDNGIS